MRLKFWIFIFFSVNLYSQDTLFFNDGSFLKAKIQSVNNEIVKYKRLDNIDGPIYSSSTSSVTKIKYFEGDSMVFNKPVNPEFKIHQKKNEEIIIQADTIVRKRSFFKFNLTNLFILKASFAFEQQINKNYLLELQTDFRPHLSGQSGSSSWSRSTVFWHNGFEIRTGLNRYLIRFRKNAFLIGLGASYRYSHASNQFYYAPYSSKNSDRGIYRFSQTRNYAGVHLKLVFQTRYKRSGIELFVQPGVYLGSVKNTYFEYQSNISGGYSPWQSTNIPPLRASFMKDGFSILPNFNFGMALRFRVSKKEEEAVKRSKAFQRDTICNKKNIFKFYITSLVSSKIAVSYERVVRRGVSFEVQPAYIYSNIVFDVATNLFVPNTSFKNRGFEIIAGVNIRGTDIYSRREINGARGFFISYRYQHTGEINYWTGGMSGKGYHYSYDIVQTKNLGSLYFKRTYFGKRGNSRWESFIIYGLYAGYARTICFYYSGNYGSDRGTPKGTYSPSGLPFSNGLVIAPFVRIGLALTSKRYNNN